MLQRKLNLIKNQTRKQGFGGIQSIRFKQETSSSKRFKRRTETDAFGKIKLSKRGETIYLARSAYKLIELDKKYNLFPKNEKQSLRIIELGAAPGGWTQVITEKLNKNNKNQHELITCDLNSIHHSIINQINQNKNIHFTQIQHDIKSLKTKEIINQSLLLNKHLPTIILSDMLAPITGLPIRDSIQSYNLNLQVIELSNSISYSNLSNSIDFLLLKHLQSEFTQQIKHLLEKNWNSVKWTKPTACRSESREGYFLARQRK